MADTTQAHTDRTSISAILAYICLGQVTLLGVAVYTIIIWRVHVDPVVLGVLGTLIAAIIGNANLALGYHLGSSAGAKTANAALAQAAGAGPPAPALPLSEPPKQEETV